MGSFQAVHMVPHRMDSAIMDIVELDTSAISNLECVALYLNSNVSRLKKHKVIYISHGFRAGFNFQLHCLDSFFYPLLRNIFEKK